MKLDYQTFKSWASQYDYVPVYRRFLADLLTPVGAYLKICGKQASFLFESVAQGKYSRYSLMGTNPTRYIKSDGEKTIVSENSQSAVFDCNVLDYLKENHRGFTIPEEAGLPPFVGGMVGYLGYETVRFYEDIPVHDKSLADVPDAVFMEFETIIAFDHFKHGVLVFKLVKPKKPADWHQQYQDVMNELDVMVAELQSGLAYELPPETHRSKLQCTVNKEEFEQAVVKAKEYIEKGDVFQLVLSQCFYRETDVAPQTLYRALRNINPSPYMFLLDFQEFQVLGASPELLVKVEQGKMEVRPIAGTRRRGKNIDEDKFLRDDLLADKKEIAEHLMLVDLGRNDVGRVCKYGTVQIPEYMTVENYSHVMHIVSDVRGELREDRDALDALYSGFPAGTTSGAPKIRAMELIHELEPHRRGVYSGAIGFFDRSGDMNTCIAIRTMLMKDKTVYFQAGAGIVYDSEPELEYKETVNKAKAIMEAIDLAEDGLISGR